MKLASFPVCADPTHYLAWPDLERTDDGRLLCLFTACTHHGDRSFSQLWLAESSDHGRSWETARPFTEACGTKSRAGYHYNNAALRRLRDGRIVAVVDRIHGGDENRHESRVLLYHSSDHGRNWTPGAETPARGIVPDRLFETSSGRWILACHHFDAACGRLVQRAWFSDDRGRTWRGPVVVGAAPGLNLCEASMVEVKGTLVALMRENSFLGLPAYRSLSHDDGLSWSEPSPFPLPGCHRPKAGYLRDGRILVTYRFCQGGRAGFANLFAALFEPEVLLRREYGDCDVRILPVDCDRSARPDTGYSGWTQFDNGELYLVNYIKDGAERAFIRGYAIPEMELKPLRAHAPHAETAALAVV